MSPWLIGGIASVLGGGVGIAVYTDIARRKKYFTHFVEEHQSAAKDFEISKQEEEEKVSALIGAHW